MKAKSIYRLEEIINLKKLSVSAFERSIGASNNSIQIAIKRGASVKDDILNKVLIAYPDINPSWLLTGEGEMIKSDAPYRYPKATSTKNEVNEDVAKYNIKKEGEREAMQGKLDFLLNTLRAEGAKEAIIDKLQKLFTEMALKLQKSGAEVVELYIKNTNLIELTKGKLII